MELRIDGDRLWQSLMEMAEIGALPGGGCRRLALTDEDREARDLFARWCHEAGADLVADQAGNMFATRSGSETEAAPVATGSHLDTQPHGGRFDGIVGVLAGVEILRTLNQHGIVTCKPVAVVNWTNEEGVRFAPGVLGSAAFAGRIGIDELHDLKSIDGCRFGDELARIGWMGRLKPGGFAIDSFFEAHIEQGPILEKAGVELGVVTHAQGIRWFDVEVIGTDQHAGTTPMAGRRDSLLAAADMIGALNRLGHEHAPHARVTVGRLFVDPNSVSTIAGRTRFVIDLRHPDEARLDEIEAAIGRACRQAAAERGCETSIRRTMSLAPVTFDPGLVDLLAAAADRLGHSRLSLISGAGHDACQLASVVPSAMIFPPSRGGISHNEAEYTAPEQLEACCNVLLHALLARAGTG